MPALGRASTSCFGATTNAAVRQDPSQSASPRHRRPFTDVAVFDERTGALSFGKRFRRRNGWSTASTRRDKARSDFARRAVPAWLDGAINISGAHGARTALLITEGFATSTSRPHQPPDATICLSQHVPLIERRCASRLKSACSHGEIERPLDETRSRRSASGWSSSESRPAPFVSQLLCRAEHEARAKAIWRNAIPRCCLRLA